MKIAVVTQYFPTSAQPWAGHSAYQTLRVLAQRHDVHVFYPESRYPGLLRPKSRAYDALDPAWQPEGVRATYIPYPALPVVSRPLNGWLMFRRLLPHVRAWRPDIILNYVVYPDGYAAARIGERLRVPVVLTAIGSDLNRIPDRLTRRFTVAALRRAAFTTTVSLDLLGTARRLGADQARSSAILNGCDTGVFHPQDRAAAREALGVNANEEVVLYVGRLDVRKGLIELVEAAAQLRASRPAMRVDLLGDGPDRPAIEAAIARSGLDAIVRIRPAVRTHGVAQWMAASNLVTLPSYKEGCPNVVIEALASGRPVVATDVGGIPELMGEASGELVPSHDATALAGALGRVLDRAWDADRLASHHNRSWADVCDDLEAVLKEAAATPAQRRTQPVE